MTNEELFARQIHNLNRGLHNIALALKLHITAVEPEEEVAVLEHLNKSMADFHHTLDSLQEAVRRQNSQGSIILPN